MAGKMPIYRMVIGKRSVGVLWDAVGKQKGTKYFSGNIDVTALKDAINEGGTKKQKVRINKAGDMAEHDVIRVSMFYATTGTQQASAGSAKAW